MLSRRVWQRILSKCLIISAYEASCKILNLLGWSTRLWMHFQMRKTLCWLIWVRATYFDASSGKFSVLDSSYSVFEWIIAFKKSWVKGYVIRWIPHEQVTHMMYVAMLYMFIRIQESIGPWCTRILRSQPIGFIVCLTPKFLLLFIIRESRCVTLQ